MTTAGDRWRIRGYTAADRGCVRHICCETGFLGRPVDPIFNDRELFADFQTGYYLAREPHNVLIAERDGQPGGYLMLCADGKAYARFLARQLPGLALRVLWKMAAGRLSRATRRYIRWLIVRGWREVPRRPAGACHFHVNALPAARGAGMGIRLITEMESLAATRGIHKLYGQMTVQPGRRGAALFRHWGWQLTDTKPVSKFREHYGRDCLLATIEKEL